MLENKDFNQAEELSEYLDAVSDGRFPIIQNAEIGELVEMANLVKQSYSQEILPQLLISELVDNLATELKAQKKQKRRAHWLYGGLVGTAAAVVMAAFVQFLLPPAADNNIAQQFDNRMETQKDVAVADHGSAPIISSPTPKPPSGQQVQSGNNTEIPVTQSVATKATDDFSKVLAEIIQPIESPAIAQKPSQVAMLQQERSKDMTRTKSVLMAKTDTDFLSEDKGSQPAGRISMMVLPNQTAPSITVDNKSGAIRQVYNQGTLDEIIITQHLLAARRTKIKDDAQQGAGQRTAERTALPFIHKEAKDSMNSLTIIVNKYSIRIEGKKTQEDLQKIAASLIMKDAEP